jgi:predicted RNA-binding Zn-ribbon protein involved in translation (DUF1610 family)
MKEIPIKEKPQYEFLQPCINPEHDPPKHMVYPRDRVYEHTCPSCGKVTIVQPSRLTW